MRPGRFDGRQGQDFGDFLRRELHAAADQIEPGADGLERIREKIRTQGAHASQARGVMALWLAVAGFASRSASSVADLFRRLWPARLM